MTYVLEVRCANGHVTDVPMVNAQLAADGTVDGYCGSAADFCDTCDAAVVERIAVEQVVS